MMSREEFLRLADIQVERQLAHAAENGMDHDIYQTSYRSQIWNNEEITVKQQVLAMRDWPGGLFIATVRVIR
jgi:spore coat protein U-like protein